MLFGKKEDARMTPESRLLPLLPLRDIVVFPHMMVPLYVGRAKSINAVEQLITGRPPKKGYGRPSLATESQNAKLTLRPVQDEVILRAALRGLVSEALLDTLPPKEGP